MKTILTNIILLFISIQLRAEIPTGPIRYNSDVAVDFQTRAPLGSLTRLCKMTRDHKFLFVTAAHVIENSSCAQRLSSTGPVANCLAIQGKEFSLTLEAIDSSKDVAILSLHEQGVKIITFNNIGCVENYNESEPLPIVYDILAQLGLPNNKYALEGFDHRTGNVSRVEFQGSIGVSNERGLPGRDETGRLIMLLGSGSAIPGFSGGAVTDFSRVNNFIGMVIAVDVAGRQLVLLPSNIIEYMAIQIMMGGKRIWRVSERSVPGGVEYLGTESKGSKVNAIHYRCDRPGLLKGHGIRSAIPAGNGHRSDGSNVSRCGTYNSGIEVYIPRRAIRQRWLSMGQWSEGEPFHLDQTTRLKLMEPESLMGLYEESGNLFASSESVPLPVFFNGASEECRPITLVKFPNSMQKARICEHSERHLQTFSLAIPKSDGKWHVLQMRLRRTCNGSGDRCLVQRESLDFDLSRLKDINSRTDFNPNNIFDGFRTVTFGENYWLRVDFLGGLEIRERGTSGRESSAMGPMIDESEFNFWRNGITPNFE